MDEVARLKSIPLFARLSPDNLARLAEISTWHPYPKDALLCRQDEFGDTLYIIDSGEAILRQTDQRGLERPVGVLKAGQSFGDDALLLGSAYSASVQALTLVEAVGIRKAEFDRLKQERPQLEKQMRIPRLIKEQLRTRALPGQDKDEPWLLRRRRHWFALARRLPIALIAAVLFFLVALGLYLLGLDIGLPLVVLLIGVLPLGMVIWFFLDWRNDFYLVTEQRVLHREKTLFLSDRQDEAPLDRIQQTNVVDETIGNLLGFGNLEIYTAASVRGKMTWDCLPDPKGMKAVIDRQCSNLRSKSLQTRLRTNREEIRQELLQQTGRAPAKAPAPIAPPPPDGPKKQGFLSRLWPSRPQRAASYELANQIVWRKHPFFLLKRIYLALPSLLLLSAAILFIAVSESLGDSRLPLLLACIVLWPAALFWLWWQWEDYQNDVYIVTDSKIIDVEKKPLIFAEQRREADLDKIQNINLDKPGLLANLLNYGDVKIETAGATGVFTFDGVGRPAEVQREIYRRIEQYKQWQELRDKEQRKAEMSAWFQEYDKMTRPPGQPANG